MIDTATFVVDFLEGLEFEGQPMPHRVDFDADAALFVYTDASDFEAVVKPVLEQVPSAERPVPSLVTVSNDETGRTVAFTLVQVA